VPGSNSIASITSKSQRLTAAIAQNADRLTLPEAQKTEFDQAQSQFLDLLARRDNLQAEKQALSRQLHDSAQRLGTATIDMKHLVMALLGSTNEKVTEFQMKPRRQKTVADRSASKKASRERAKQKAAQAALSGPTVVPATPAAPAAPVALAAPVAPAETQG